MAATHSGDRALPFSCFPLSALPPLLACVLQHVPQQQRLASCALVSRDWAAAAAAGTFRIDCKDLNSSRCMSLGPWIQKHGRQLQSIQLNRQCYSLHSDPQLQLPCSELRQLTALQLSGLKLHLPGCDNRTTSSASSASSSTPSQHVPKLQDLRLERCIFDSTSALLQLGPFAAVTQLSLQHLQFVMPQDPGSPAAPEVSDAQSLLTSTAVLGLLQHMPKLQRLHIDQLLEESAWAAATLPPSITALTVDFNRASEVDHTWRFQHNLQQLGGLQELKLRCGEFHPAALSRVPQLKVLELHSCIILPDDPDGAVRLLAAVGCLQQLRRLVINETDVDVLTAALLSSYSSATASSHLTHLQITCEDYQALPEGALQHLFPAGKPRLQLQSLSLSSMFPSDETPFMTCAELAGMLKECPALTSLDIRGALQPEESCSALLQLPPTCRQLSVGGDTFGDSAAATVAQLTQLTRLEWVTSSITDAGLYQLTALQGLMELLLDNNHELSEGLVYKLYGAMSRPLKLLAGDNPVWQQLRDKLHACPSNAAWVVLLDQQQQHIKHLQQTIALQQQEIQRLQQHCVTSPATPAAGQQE